MGFSARCFLVQDRRGVGQGPAMRRAMFVSSFCDECALSSTQSQPGSWLLAKLRDGQQQTVAENMVFSTRGSAGDKGLMRLETRDAIGWIAQHISSGFFLASRADVLGPKPARNLTE